MSERPSNDNENVDGEAAPETAESAETAEDAGSKAREQAPAHVPPHLRDLFTKLANGHLDKDINALMPWAYAQQGQKA